MWRVEPEKKLLGPQVRALAPPRFRFVWYILWVCFRIEISVYMFIPTQGGKIKGHMYYCMWPCGSVPPNSILSKIKDRRVEKKIKIRKRMTLNYVKKQPKVLKKKQEPKLLCT